MIRDSDDEHTSGLQAPQALKGSVIVHPKGQRQAPLDPQNLSAAKLSQDYTTMSVFWRKSHSVVRD